MKHEYHEGPNAIYRETGLKASAQTQEASKG
jgi:hypothetical protein